MAKNRVSSLISRGGTYSTTSRSKYISMDTDTGKPKYIPKTKENMQALVRAKGKPDVYSDKKYGKRCIWW